MNSGGLKRLDVVQFLEETYNNKISDKEERISPSKDEYKIKYIQYVCFKLDLGESDLPHEIYHDIFLIKSYYSKCQYSVERMIKKHQRFFETPAVHIKGAPIVPPPKRVCSFLK